MDDDATLPKATLNTFIKELVSPPLKVTHEYSDLILEISKEFIKNVASEANQLCLRDGKKTISPDFIFNALKELKLEEYLPELIVSHNNYLDETNEKNNKKNKFSNVENWEELEAQQQKLFELSKNYNLSSDASRKEPQTEKINEEKNEEKVEFENKNTNLFKNNEVDFENY